MEIKINKLHKSAILPTRANDSDAGYDLYAIQDMIVGPMDKAIVPTGISIEIPKGYYGRVAPRSGLAVKNGIDVYALGINWTNKACNFNCELDIDLKPW